MALALTAIVSPLDPLDRRLIVPSSAISAALALLGGFLFFDDTVLPRVIAVSANLLSVAVYTVASVAVIRQETRSVRSGATGGIR